MKSLIVVFSYHHKNTEKVANAIAKALDAQVKTPHDVNPDELKEYDLVGFGSGIYSEMLHQSVLDLADKLPKVNNGKAFVFSTNGVPAFLSSKSFESGQLSKNHRLIKEKLQSKGYAIVDEFTCPGFNTNSFLKSFGGINKGRPNAEDLKRAEEFAQKMKQNLQ